VWSHTQPTSGGLLLNFVQVSIKLTCSSAIGICVAFDDEACELPGKPYRLAMRFPTEAIQRLLNGCFRIGGQDARKRHPDHSEAMHRERFRGLIKCYFRQAQFDKPRQRRRITLETATLVAALDDGLRRHAAVFHGGQNAGHSRVEVPRQLAVAGFASTGGGKGRSGIAGCLADA